MQARLSAKQDRHYSSLGAVPGNNLELQAVDEERFTAAALFGLAGSERGAQLLLHQDSPVLQGAACVSTDDNIYLVTYTSDDSIFTLPKTYLSVDDRVWLGQSSNTVQYQEALYAVLTRQGQGKKLLYSNLSLLNILMTYSCCMHGWLGVGKMLHMHVSPCSYSVLQAWWTGQTAEIPYCKGMVWVV